MIAMRKETAVKSNNNSPTIRFAGFSDDWKLCEFREIAERASSISNQKGLPRVEYEDIISGTGQLVEAFFSKESEKSGITFHKGDVLYGKLRPYLKNWLLPNFPGIAVGDFWVLQPTGADSSFLYRLIQSRQFEETANRSTGTKMPRADWKLVSNSTFSVPSTIEEQREIGAYIEQVDTLITLHQRNHEKLVNFKKAMLDKMFPKNGELVPEVRFAGFSGNWERRKFRDVFAFLQNNTLPRAYLVNAGEGAKNIHYGDVLIKFGECVDVSSESLPIIEDVNVINKYRSSALRNGDIIIADTAEDETAGKCTEIVGNNSEILLAGLHTVPCRPVINFAERYLGYYMNSRIFHNQLLPHMQGIKVVSISRSALQSTVIHYPKEIKEQLQIARLFNALDSQLVLLQQKLERFQNIKKACMEKMFV